MSNKAVANWLIASFVIIMLSVISGGDEFFDTIGGLIMWVFGIWAIVKLYKQK